MSNESEVPLYFGIDVPFMTKLGLRTQHLEDGACRTSLVLEASLTNSMGGFHGGVILSVLDFTMSAAARSHDPLGVSAATIDLSSHFLRPARTDLVIDAKVIRRSASMAFCDGSITDTSGALVAVARAVFKLIPKHAHDS